MADREAIFDRVFEDADEKQLQKAIDFREHRFVSVERDKLTMNRYAKGHKSLRGACSYLARAVEEGDAFVPEYVVDLDTGDQHEIDLFAFVAPKSVEAVALMMPLGLAEEVVETLSNNDPHANAIKINLFRQAIDRRKS